LLHLFGALTGVEFVLVCRNAFLVCRNRDIKTIASAMALIRRRRSK
jgi:hypothetical protein